MRVDRVHLKAFRQHADTVIQFPETGVIGLVGPNESGKSTVLEAISFALYGTRACRGTKDSLRWNGAPSRTVAEVTLAFHVGDTDYRVHRTEHDAELREPGGQVLAEGIRAVDARVPKLLGMDLDEFESTYLARQKDLQRLEEMGGVEKRQFVLGLMGLGQIDDALSELRERKNELKTELQGLREGLGERDPLLSERDEAHQALVDAEEALESAISEAKNAEKLKELAEDQLQEAREAKQRHDDLAQVRDRAREAASEAGDELERLNVKLEEARAAAEELQDRREEIEPLSDLHDERERLQEARARRRERETLEGLVEGKQAEVERLEEAVAEADRMVEKLSSDPDPREALTEEREKLETARDQLRTVADHDKVATLREHLEAGESCPVCEQAVSDVPEPSEAQRAVREAREAVDEAEVGVEEAKGAVRQLEKYEEQRDRLSDRLDSERSDLERAQEKLSDVDVPAFDATRLAQVNEEIERLETIEEELRELKAKADRIPEISEERNRWAEKATDAKAREEKALSALEDLDFDGDRYERLASEVDERREAAQSAAQTLSRAEAEHEAAEKRLERAKKQLAAYDERAETVEAVEEEHRLHVMADERLTAFRAAEARSVRPELEELVSGFLSVLTDGRHEAVRLTEDFDVRVLEHGQEQEVVSGGAQDVSAIALRLAISQLIAERAGHPLSLLVLDEPFGSLDAVRRQNVLELIRQLGGVFSQVLLITHVESVQDAVDHAYRVEFDEAEGMSRVTLEQTTRVEEAA